MERTDRLVVLQAGAGDPDALRQVVDEQVDVVHGVTTVLLGAEAAPDATADVFAAVAARIGQLPDPDHLRPWVLAICRNRCLGWPVDASWRPSAHDELRTAAYALEARDRLLVELAIAGHVSGPELSSAMGHEPGRADALAQRAGRRAAGAVGALRLARTGGERCPTLAVLVAGRRDDFDSDLRRTVVRHAADCDVCEVPEVAPLPAAVITSAPLLVRDAALAAARGERAAPEELLDGWTEGWPPAAGAEPRAADGEEVLAGVAAWAPPVADDRHRLALVIGALVLLALVGSVWLVGRGGGGDGPEVALLGVAEQTFPSSPSTSQVPTTPGPPAAATSSPLESESGVAPATATPTSTVASTATTSTTAAPAQQVSAPPRQPPAPPVTRSTTTTSTTTTSTTTEPPGGPMLAPSPAALALAPGSSGTVRLSNVGPETATWSASPSVGIGVSPASGSLGAGRSVVLTISTSSRASSGSVTINGGAAPVSIAVEVVPPPAVPPSTTSTSTTTTEPSTTTTVPASTTTAPPVTVVIDDENGSVVIDGSVTTETSGPATTSP